jgi:outer membrane lipoprotein carrier protein
MCFTQTAENVAHQLERELFSFQTLEAKFEHIFYSAMVSTPLQEKGKLFLKKPDMMRWEYTDPEKNIYLYKGSTFQFYFSEDNQLMRGSLTEESHETDILFILTGRKSLLDFYKIEFSPFPTESPENAQIKLTPKQENEDTSILLEIDTQKWLIKKAVFFDWEGNKTEFRFSGIKTDIPLPKDIFTLKLPANVEIIER